MLQIGVPQHQMPAGIDDAQVWHFILEIGISLTTVEACAGTSSKHSRGTWPIQVMWT